MTASTAASVRYSRTAIALHWLLAVAIIGAFALGLYMMSLPFSPSRLKLFNWHKWLGVTILTLSFLRLFWRLTHRPPALPAGMPTWQRGVSHGAHYVLYALFFAVPLIGWAYSSAAGFPIVWFGVLPLPDFVSPNTELAAALKPWHGILAKALMAVVVLHVLAAFKHQFINRDGLLSRMMPGRRA